MHKDGFDTFFIDPYGDVMPCNGTKDKEVIIVPVYNVSKYLNKCIESLLAQTYKYIKIILVDDGSTDGSEKICDNYIQFLL